MKTLINDIMVNIFGRLADKKGKAIRKMLANDPEIIAAKKEIDAAEKKANKKAKEIYEKTGLKLSGWDK